MPCMACMACQICRTRPCTAWLCSRADVAAADPCSQAGRPWQARHTLSPCKHCLPRPAARALAPVSAAVLLRLYVPATCAQAPTCPRATHSSQHFNRSSAHTAACNCPHTTPPSRSQAIRKALKQPPSQPLTCTAVRPTQAHPATRSNAPHARPGQRPLLSSGHARCSPA
jgi:hypothetical protein